MNVFWWCHNLPRSSHVAEVSCYDHTEVCSLVQGQFRCFSEKGKAYTYYLFRFLFYFIFNHIIHINYNLEIFFFRIFGFILSIFHIIKCDGWSNKLKYKMLLQLYDQAGVQEGTKNLFGRNNLLNKLVPSGLKA